MRARPVRSALTGALTLGLALYLTASPAAAGKFFGKGVEGSGDLETRELELGAFTAIDLGGAFDVDIAFGDRQRVSVTIDDNLWDLLEAEERKGELTLGWRKSCRPDDGCRVEIVMARLEKMEISGAGDVRIRGFAGDRFEFSLSGAAELEMDGKVDDLDVRVSGAGDIDTRRLVARSAEVHISGAGNADVYASERFEGTVSGVGNIDYWGSPAHERTRTSGLGHITRRD